MKIGKKEINLIIGLLGIVIAVATWMLVVSPMKEKTAAIEAENVGLKEKAEEYQAVNAQKPQFEADTVKLVDERAQLLKQFAAGMTKEDEIMYWANTERANASTLAISNLSIGGWEEVYVEGQPSADEEGATQLHLYRAPVNYQYKATYQGVKDLVQYVFAQNDKKSIEQLNVAFDSSTGNLNGAIDINMYYMNGTGNDYVPSVIPTVPTGVADIFHSDDNLETSSDVSSFEGEAEGTEE